MIRFVPKPDRRRTLHVDVTAEDLATGRPRDIRCCAMALAVRRAVEDKVYVTVHRGWLWIDDQPYLLPDEAREFLHAHDLQQPVGPVSFAVEVGRK